MTQQPYIGSRITINAWVQEITDTALGLSFQPDGAVEVWLPLREQDSLSTLSEQDSRLGNLDRLAQELDAISIEELIEARDTISALVNAKVGNHQGLGHIERKMIPDKKSGKQYGPYRYLRYWKDGKLKSRYLGKENKPE